MPKKPWWDKVVCLHLVTAMVCLVGCAGSPERNLFGAPAIRQNADLPCSLSGTGDGVHFTIQAQIPAAGPNSTMKIFLKALPAITGVTINSDISEGDTIWEKDLVVSSDQVEIDGTLLTSSKFSLVDLTFDLNADGELTFLCGMRFTDPLPLPD